MVYIAYTDGRYKDDLCASAGIITPEGKSEWVILTKVNKDPVAIKHKSASAEIYAVYLVLEHALNVLQLGQNDTLVLRYDYTGIEAWCADKCDTARWTAKKKLTRDYAKYVNNVIRPRFNLRFEKVKSKEEFGNTIVDKLARIAMDNYIALGSEGGVL